MPHSPQNPDPPHPHTDRRAFLAGGFAGFAAASAFLAGCSKNPPYRGNPSSAIVPLDANSAPPIDTAATDADRLREILAGHREKFPNNQVYTRTPTPTPNPAASARTVIAGLAAIPRGRWTAANPITSRLNPMNGVKRITIHHEGWDPFWTTNDRDTAERLELIRVSHLERLRAGDIGYHFIIDRAGRIWAGRDLKYQGAHVKNYNENNIGIMVLGNFDRQKPADKQLAALGHTVASLKNSYRIHPRDIKSHQEYNPTRCPGRFMQSKMNALRASVA